MIKYLKSHSQIILAILSPLSTIIFGLMAEWDKITNSKVLSFHNVFTYLFWIGIVWTIIYVQNLFFQGVNLKKLKKEIDADNAYKFAELRKDINLEFRYMRLLSRMNSGLEWHHDSMVTSRNMNFDNNYTADEKIFLRDYRQRFNQVYGHGNY